VIALLVVGGGSETLRCHAAVLNILNKKPLNAMWMRVEASMLCARCGLSARLPIVAFLFTQYQDLDLFFLLRGV
jgi:hypothetical protein